MSYVRTNTRLKRAQGFGALVELPAPLYLQGALMGVLDSECKLYYYALPDVDEKKGKNYARCSHYGNDGQALIPVETSSPWNPTERAARIDVASVADVLLFLRGMYRHFDSAVQRWHPVTEFNQQANLLALYIGEMSLRCQNDRNWNLSLEQFVLSQSSDKAREWMLEALNTSTFDWMEHSLQSYRKTTHVTD